MNNNPFNTSSSVQSSRILYTPSPFAKSSLLHLQEAGSLKAIKPHTNQRERLHSYLFFIVNDGNGELYYEGKHYQLGVGDAVFIDCQKPYAHSTGKDGKLWSIQWCHFYGSSMTSIYTKYCSRGGEPVIHTNNTMQYEGLLTELYNIAGSSDYIRDMRINEKLNRLLTLLMETSWHSDSHGHQTKKLEIDKIKEYIDEHYQEKLSLDTVASYFFIDKSYLARLFKKHYGMTLTTYLQQVRITHAKSMLRFTDKRIEEIGLECGIGELNYFSRVFKKLEGMSPSEFRKIW